VEPHRLECSQIVYRSATAARHWDKERNAPTSHLFLRRPRDVTGLSVDFNVRVPDECAPEMSGKRGVVSLHTGWIRDRELDVIPDDTHAGIRGLPDPQSDRLKAEQHAAALVEIARVEWSLDD